MERMLTDELTRTMLIFGMAAAGSLGFMVKLISRVHGSFKPYFKVTVLYLLVAIVLISGIASLSYWSYLKDQQVFHLVFMAYFLILGIAHVNWLKEYVKWAGNEQSLWAEFLFTLVLGLLGGTGFMAVFSYFSEATLAFNMSMSIIFFIVPWLLNQTFSNAMAIPAGILKRWYYPSSEEMGEPDEDKLKNLLVISFLIQKQPDDPRETHFRAKAPVDMEMGELFYYFINDYNERHPNDKIAYMDKSGEPYGWLFFKRNPYIRFIEKYVDAEKTIFNNQIRENNVIRCNRTLSS
ncbi:TssN family type VI secretion system protein [Cyclobacterium plantarum]|uniref:TssN family type VI secretion system protein n=1 Tax=Cyclobacterium plantarum TaxID=2716263 RepID=A0ABX0HDA8_9BACT|nr:TssN family type VI secretion system protein [Cyclobacterium plantarum]NHE58472.1 TssN family type VI secretion system protein [Cyclobacterium plantarum]